MWYRITLNESKLCVRNALGTSVDFSLDRTNALVLEQHTDLIPEQSKGLSLCGTETRLRDLWVVAFNPQSSLGVV